MTIPFVSRIDAVIDGAIAAKRIVGAVVLVARDGETIHARAAGLADREAGIPMREDAIFRLASVSKLFTATAVLAMVAEGRLDLDRPITDWLPTFTPTFDGRPAVITLRHLLSHSAGLGYGFFEPEDGPLHRAGVSDGMDRSGSCRRPSAPVPSGSAGPSATPSRARCATAAGWSAWGRRRRSAADRSARPARACG